MNLQENNDLIIYTYGNPHTFLDMRIAKVKELAAGGDEMNVHKAEELLPLYEYLQEVCKEGTLFTNNMELRDPFTEAVPFIAWVGAHNQLTVLVLFETSNYQADLESYINEIKNSWEQFHNTPITRTTYTIYH